MLNIKSKALKLFTGLMVAAFLLTGAVSVHAATISFSATTVKKGAPKADVMTLQSSLNSILGTNLPAQLVVDGSYGAKTTAAIKQFQTWVNTQGGTTLTADGIAGPKTLAKLIAVMAGTTMTNGGGTSMTPCPAGALFNPATGAACTTGTGTGTGTGTQTGPLSVSLATDNPAAGTLIQGQATADLAHFMFTGTGTLSQVTLQRSGISDNSVFPNVYLYNGNTRLTDSASINSNGQIVFNGVNAAVNGSLDLSVRADIVASTATSQSTVMVTLTGYMASGSTTANAVSIPANVFQIRSGSGVLSSVTVGANTVSAQTVSAGTVGMALWSAPITVNLHSVMLKSAAFDAIGSAPSSALANIGLYANGVKIGSSTGINSMNYITFDLSAAPYTFLTGATTLEVRGDVVNGSYRDITLSLQHASDLMVTDSQVGVNVGVITQGQTLFQIMSAGKITIQQGSLVAQSDPAFNSITNVTGGATNVAIASYKFTSYGEDVKLNQVTVTPVISGSPAACSALSSGAVALNNVTLYYNGAPVGSSQNAVSTGGCTMAALSFTPGSNLTIAGGTTGIFQVHADLINGAGTPVYSSGSVAATVVVNQYQGISSGTTSTLSPSGSNSMTISAGALTVSANASYLGQTINPNTSGAKIGSFVLQNQSTSEAVQVNSLTVGLYSNSGISTPFSPITNFSTLTLAGIPGTVTPIGQPTTSNVFSTNFTIPAGGSQVVDIVANLGSTNTGSVYTSLVPTAVGANSRVPITSSPVAGQQITLSVGTLSSPTLVSSSSTNPQYISSGGTGAANAAQETYNFVATTGTANITGLKFAALTGVSKAYTSGGTFTATGSTGAVTVASGDVFTTGDNVLISTTGIYGGQDAVGTVTAHSSGSVTINLTTPMVLGFTDVGLTTPGVPGKVFQLATSGATGVALNSTGVATGSATFNGGIAYISSITGGVGANGIMVPNSPSGVTVPVFVSYGPVNTNGGVASGTVSQILLEYVQYQTGSNTSYSAPTATTAAGTTITLVGSKPNIALGQSTAALTNGTSVLVGTVTVTADNTGDIALAEIPLTVSLSSGTSGTPVIVANGVTLTDTNGATIGGTFTATNSAGTTSATATEVFGSGTSGHYRISAGSSKTFEIHVNFTGSTMGTSATASVSLGSSANFVWDDINGNNVSNVATNGTITSGLSGAALYSYPTGSVSIHN